MKTIKITNFFVIVLIILFNWSPIIAQDIQLIKTFINKAGEGDIKTVKALIDVGIDVNSQDPNTKRTALMSASGSAQKEIVKLLISCGANVNLKNNYDMTALHYAAINGSSEIVDILLKNGADATIKDKGEKTPIVYAASGGFADIVKLLAGTSPISGVKSVTQADRIILKNGDVVTGELLTPIFTIRTSYGGSITFNRTDIKVIAIEGGGQNIDTILLRNGDKLSGVVGPDSINIRLEDKQSTKLNISKDKIKEINLK
jgi:hypothetical protein